MFPVPFIFLEHSESLGCIWGGGGSVSPSRPAVRWREEGSVQQQRSPVGLFLLQSPRLDQALPSSLRARDACLLLSPFLFLRMLTRARAASLQTVESKGPPPTRTSCPGDLMPPTPATHPPPAEPSWAVTAAAVPRGMPRARGCTRTSGGNWR